MNITGVFGSLNSRNYGILERLEKIGSFYLVSRSLFLCLSAFITVEKKLLVYC